MSNAEKINSVEELYSQAMALDEDGELTQAISRFEEVIELDPQHHQAYAEIARISLEYHWVDDALENYAKAIKAAADNIEYKRKFTHLAQLYEVTKPNEHLKYAVLACMQEQNIDQYPLSRLWMSLMVTEPAFKALYDISENDDYALFKKTFGNLKNHAFFCDEFFLTSLCYMVAYNRNFENIFKNLRRLLLENLNAKDFYFDQKDYTALAASLAHYCFFTEYVLFETDEEIKLVDALKSKAENGKVNDTELSVLACYMPLHSIKNINSIIDGLSSQITAVQSLVQQQITDIADRAKLASTIPSLTSVDNPTSQKVQEMYEHAPYPRWRGYSTEYKHKKYEGENVADGGEILVAGCGTGQDAIEMAAKYKNANITAIDLSLPSLAYATQKAKEFGIDNISFAQADILAVESLDKKFDFIVSSGVLHHMKEPLAGLTALEKVLNPGGLMRLSLYSKYARRHVINIQNAIKENGYGNDDASIKKSRANIDDIAAPEDLAYILRTRDFYSMPECRDMLFHVQEHNMDLKEIGAMLKSAKLKFLGFYVTNDILAKYYIRNFWDFRARSLKRWHKFETKHPDTFTGMYVFWCQKP